MRPKTTLLMLTVILRATLCLAALSPAERARIDEITGAKGEYTETEDVYKVSFPRGDLKVTVDGWAMQPFMGTTSWAAFTTAGDSQTMVMGDLALAEDEVNPVMSVLLASGIEITALHNHFFFDRPRVMFMHIGGQGDAAKLADAVRKAMDQVHTIRAARPSPQDAFLSSPPPDASSISAPPLEQVFGNKAQPNHGMLKFTFGRTTRVHGHELAKQMGVNTWAAFAGSDDNAFVDGDFAMHESELQGVLKTLRDTGINIVAIHNHMTHEEPRLMFLHYWGRGKAADLARGVKSALDTLGK